MHIYWHEYQFQPETAQCVYSVCPGKETDNGANKEYNRDINNVYQVNVSNKQNIKQIKYARSCCRQTDRQTAVYQTLMERD